jgi:hypothetical protein
MSDVIKFHMILHILVSLVEVVIKKEEGKYVVIKKEVR